MGGKKTHGLTGKPRVGKPRGNPQWGRKPASFITPVIHRSGFEMKVTELRLRPDQYALSLELREWARRFVKSRYIPESLLEAWGIYINNADLY